MRDEPAKRTRPPRYDIPSRTEIEEESLRASAGRVQVSKMSFGNFPAFEAQPIWRLVCC